MVGASHGGELNALHVQVTARMTGPAVHSFQQMQPAQPAFPDNRAGSSSSEGQVSAALGTKWAHAVNVRLILEKRETCRVITVRDSCTCRCLEPRGTFSAGETAVGAELSLSERLWFGHIKQCLWHQHAEVAAQTALNQTSQVVSSMKRRMTQASHYTSAVTARQRVFLVVLLACKQHGGPVSSHAAAKA